jgi:hypothetical protein
MPKINSYTNWGRLEEVWLGDCYPAHFYDHLDAEVRDVFYEITEKTQTDLTIIQKKLEEFGVIVQRPHYSNIENYLKYHDKSGPDLVKPEICPRDNYLVAGNNLIGSDMYNVWGHALKEYSDDSESHLIEIVSGQHIGKITGANSVRAGRDIYLDIFYSHDKNSGIDKMLSEFQNLYAKLFQDYRVHILFNGGHIDGCFAAISPGVLLTSKYFTQYDLTFPQWKMINIHAPEFMHHRALKSLRPPMDAKKWWETGSAHSFAFNNHIIKYAKDWVGDYTETYFEVNCLVIDEKNVLMLGENESVFRELEKYGITAHSLPFRTRTFWDGGLHCLTLDIRRQDSMVDLFPDRSRSLYLYS